MPVLDLTYGRPELRPVRAAVAKDDPAAPAEALSRGVTGAADGADRGQPAASLLVETAARPSRRSPNG